MPEIKESEHIIQSDNYFNENSDTPFVRPAPKAPKMIPVAPVESAVTHKTSIQDLPAPIAVVNDDSTAGQLLDLAAKLYQATKSGNTLEKIKLLKKVTETVNKLQEEALEEKQNLIRELGLG